MSGTKVAIVTGGNKGVGFAVVRGLAKKFEGDVFLTSRDVKRGEEAVAALKGEGLTVKFHQLDINDRASIEKLRDYMKENYAGIDVLVNNAAIAFKQAATEPMGVQAEVTIATNYFSVKETCELLFPLLRKGARVTNVSSAAGFLPYLRGKEPEADALRKKLATSDSTLSVDELSQMMNDFIKAAKDGTHADKGWPNSTYMVSKLGLSSLTRIQQREFNKTPELDIAVNHVHPGYVDTDMSSHKGHLSIDEGARSAIFTALLPPNTEMKGKFFWDACQEVDWVNGPPPTKF